MNKNIFLKSLRIFILTTIKHNKNKSQTWLHSIWCATSLLWRHSLYQPKEKMTVNQYFAVEVSSPLSLLLAGMGEERSRNPTNHLQCYLKRQ